MKVLIHPEIAAVLRTLTIEEYAGLRNKLLLEECTQSFPYFMLGGKAYQLDGHHRRKICKEEGLPCEFYEIKMPNLEEAIKWVKDNQEARRNSTPEELRALREKRIERVVEARKEGQSTRTIAEAEGVSQPQVLRDLKAAADTGVSAEPKGGKIMGKDGKKQAATKTKPESILCERCQRVGVVQGCQACEITRRERITPSPREPRQSRNGSTVFDWPDFKRHYGHVAKVPETLRRAYPQLVEPTEYAAAVRLLNELSRLLDALEKRIKKSIG